jgi:hypothetical protein
MTPHQAPGDLTPAEYRAAAPGPNQLIRSTVEASNQWDDCSAGLVDGLGFRIVRLVSRRRLIPGFQERRSFGTRARTYG